MHYTGQVYRYPIEADTPLLEVTAGCSHNACAFCTMYRETKFRVSPLTHVEEDLKELKSTGRPIKRIFLVNGEPFILATEKLIEIGELINQYCPEIEIITCYASIKSLRNKTVEDLKRLKELKFDELHIGLESAYEPAVLQMNKGFTVEEAYENIEKLTKADMSWDAIVNNAGVFVVDSSERMTPDGVDVRFAVNTISPYILTKMLLPIVAEQGRIINLSSAAQAPVDLAKLQNKGVFSHDEAYAQSKLAITMWSMELAEAEVAKEKNIVVASVNPKSFLGSKMVKVAYGKEGYDLQIGADILMDAIFSEKFADAYGKYYDNDACRFSKPHSYALDQTHRSQLMAYLNEVSEI